MSRLSAIGATLGVALTLTMGSALGLATAAPASAAPATAVANLPAVVSVSAPVRAADASCPKPGESILTCGAPGSGGTSSSGAVKPCVFDVNVDLSSCITIPQGAPTYSDESLRESGATPEQIAEYKKRVAAYNAGLAQRRAGGSQPEQPGPTADPDDNKAEENEADDNKAAGNEAQGEQAADEESVSCAVVDMLASCGEKGKAADTQANTSAYDQYLACTATNSDGDTSKCKKIETGNCLIPTNSFKCFVVAATNWGREGAATFITTINSWWLKGDSILPTNAGVSGMVRSSLSWIAVAVATAGVMWQGILMAITRKANPLFDVWRGLFTLVLWGGIGIVGPAYALIISDMTAAWIMDHAKDYAAAHNQPAPGLAGAVMLYAYTSITLAPLTILFSILALLASLVQALIMTFREGTIVVLAGCTVLAAAGSMTQSTKPWLGKVLSWMLALITYKPAAALVYAASSYMYVEATGVKQMVIGLMLMFMAIVALPAMMKMFNWAGGRIESGGGGMAAAASVFGTAALYSRAGGPMAPTGAGETPGKGPGLEGPSGRTPVPSDTAPGGSSPSSGSGGTGAGSEVSPVKPMGDMGGGGLGGLGAPASGPMGGGAGAGATDAAAKAGAGATAAGGPAAIAVQGAQAVGAAVSSLGKSGGPPAEES